ncbi:hypothetical protein [Kineococcus sp. SYSU DK002]|uniref:hypothetical protein n=1 Tax=Kineococcus sp. SYSU DK002 TaxID=3383123 RepID=UPI003D7C3D57
MPDVVDPLVTFHALDPAVLDAVRGPVSHPAPEGAARGGGTGPGPPRSLRRGQAAVWTARHAFAVLHPAPR